MGHPFGGGRRSIFNNAAYSIFRSSETARGGSGGNAGSSPPAKGGPGAPIRRLNYSGSFRETKSKYNDLLNNNNNNNSNKPPGPTNINRSGSFQGTRSTYSDFGNNDKNNNAPTNINRSGSFQGLRNRYNEFVKNRNANNANKNAVATKTTTTNNNSNNINRSNSISNSKKVTQQTVVGKPTHYTSTTTSSTTTTSSFLQRSVSADDVIVRQRGYKPSDRHDPAKRNFLESLTSKILHRDMESGHTTPINLQKLLTPASDSSEILHTVKNKKMYASSYFYAPTHPTVEDQVELARRISSSLSDIKNVKSKGQSMYVNRKKRSVKWIHDGNGSEEAEEPPSPTRKDKVPLKCMMNPNGKVLDIQALGEEVNIQTTMPEHPERLFDIVRDLNNQKGRGAEIFAKRRKRSEKWVVDQEQPQSPSSYGYPKAPPYPMKQETIVVPDNTKFDNKSFYNPYVADIPMDYSTPPTSNCGVQLHPHPCSRASFSSAHSDCGAPPPCHLGGEVKKIYLREVAVGTEPSELACPPTAKPSSRRSSNGGQPRSCNSSVANGYSGRPTRASKMNGNHHHHHQYGHHHHHPHHHPQPHHHHYGHPAAPNGYHHPRGNPYHNHIYNGYSYLSGPGCIAVPPPMKNGNYYQNGHGYHQNGNGYPQNGNGYQQNGNGYQQNGNGYQQNGNGYQQNGNGYQQPGNEGIEEECNPEEDYTPVPVKQLIQEFEKTCRPIMQFKQCSPRGMAPMAHSQSDISRYFESTGREVAYPRQQPRNQYCGNNGYASSEGDDDEDDDDEDEEPSMDDSLSPVDFYRADDRRHENGAPANNRSSSMSTLDEYYRRQLTQYQEDGTAKFPDPEPTEGDKAANLAGISSNDITEQKKHLKNTSKLENLVAGTTTPECFKKEFTEEVASKLFENGKYHGPKISSYQNMANYNTAPRGWDSSMPVYRPIRFEKPQDQKISYSDF